MNRSKQLSVGNRNKFRLLKIYLVIRYVSLFIYNPDNREVIHIRAAESSTLNKEKIATCTPHHKNYQRGRLIYNAPLEQPDS